MASVNKLELSPQITKISFNNEEIDEKYRTEGLAPLQTG
jgi:hypothetical protein